MERLRDVMAITELRGQYPTVSIAADIDYEALVAGDANPTFVTLPIGKANVTSGNQNHYDDAFLKELERQTLTLRPVGLMGHLSDAERSSAFPQEAVHWVGAMRVADILWGKAYVVPGPVRERIARYKASGRALATSIDAMAERKWDESLKAYRVDASSLRLGQIDLAPADRAGVADLAVVPHLTREMEEPEAEPEKKEGVHMDKLQVINEMTADDARLLPTVVRDAVLANAPVAPEIAQVAELRQVLGVESDANLGKVVGQMQEQLKTQEKAAVAEKVKSLVAEGIKLESARELVSEFIASRNPQTVAEAENAFKAVCEMPSIQKLLATTVQETMGPSQSTPPQSQNGQNKYFAIPDKEG